jgi:anti-sigma B factor antagonist
VNSNIMPDCSGRITQGEGSVILREPVFDALSQGQKKISLNLADIQYCDSTGVGELVLAKTTTRNQGGSLKLLALTKKLHDLLQGATRLITCFDVFADETMALESFSTPALYYCCPLCEYASSPSVVGPVLNDSRSQLCPMQHAERSLRLPSAPKAALGR